MAERGWNKTIFTIEKSINGRPKEAISHEVDHVRIAEGGVLALEIEWNNKDPFFDRDLENFKRLHAEGAISAGIIVTRGEALQDNMRNMVLQFLRSRNVNDFATVEPYGVTPTARQRREIERRAARIESDESFRVGFTNHFVSDKFGAATTHWRKLMDRVTRGVGNPCPLILIGLPDSIVTFDEDPKAVIQEIMPPDEGDEI